MPKKCFLPANHPAALALQQRSQAARRLARTLFRQEPTPSPGPYLSIDFCAALDRVSVMLDKAQTAPLDDSEEAQLRRARAMRATIMMINSLSVRPFGRPSRAKLAMFWDALMAYAAERIRSGRPNWSLPKLVRTPLPALVRMRKPTAKRPGQHMSGPPLAMTFQCPDKDADQPVLDGRRNEAG